MRLEKNCLLSLSGAVLVAFLSIGFEAHPSFAQEAEAKRGLHYLTQRNRTGSDSPRKFYGDERSDLKAGWCEIGNVDLSLISPMADAAPFYIPDELLRVEAVREFPIEDVFGALLAREKNGAPLLHTHGFYIDFEKGCRRATLLRENIDLDGSFLWFSWPSDGSLLNYTHDEADLYWSVPDLATAIARLDTEFEDVLVNISGHSLGARGVILALYELANRDPDLRVGDVVLLAPDMDFQIFERILPRIRPLMRSMTVYVTASDRPLAVSSQLHGYPRLGEAGNDVSSLDGVEVIDLSDIPARSATGHLYHIYNKEVGEDLSQLLNEGLPAKKRRNLVPVDRNLWKLQIPE
ncbi:alpha/beta hydrolase [Sedimentitalea sp. XS_ASV28]|uniref:alpha/beta hydrolase n=1 Tax=Sedimentitalea sp. XS_ASV28 TaxID=3241296 RepID=UPI003518EB95